jgi:predicted metalloprotease with PDZ domain
MPERDAGSFRLLGSFLRDQLAEVPMSRSVRLLFTVLLVLAFSTASLAQARRAPRQNLAPAAAPSGPIQLAVDARDAPRKIFHARMTFPARAGEMTLVYPKWIPGEHGPTGPIDDVAGLKFTAGGQTLVWHRDPVDMYAIHIEVPPGATSLEALFDYLSPAEASGFSSGASASAKMTVVSWNQVLLYPANTASDDVTFQASLKLPAGWKFGAALPVASENGDTIAFQPVSLTTLVDSPVISGIYYRAVQLTPGETPSHEIDMAADSAAALEMNAETLSHFKQLIAETGALYGSRHYRDYHFLLSLSDYVAHFGLEHHESSDDRVAEHMLIDPAERALEGSLLPHEMTHSWNGKYRRPAGLATPNYQEPMKGELLWVYEGLTEYLGDVLAARSGLWTPEQYRDNIAHDAAYLGPKDRPGRTWRPLVDTTTAAQLLYEAPQSWSSWRRSVDFYDEGELIWLDADVTIRQLSGGKKSIDDFVKLFHGPGSMPADSPKGPGGVALGPPQLKPYTFDDVVNAMNQVVPNDWRKFFNDRLTSLRPESPQGGIENGGWRLVYDDKPGPLAQAGEDSRHMLNATYSIGLILNETGAVIDSVIGSPAYQAGVGPGMRVVAVNGRKFTTSGLNEALASKDNAPLELLVENAEYYKTVRIDYRDGKRYPHLLRDPSKPDVIADIIRQKAATVAPPQMKMEIVVH